MKAQMQKILDNFTEEFGCPEYRTTHYLPNGKIISKGKVTAIDIKKFIQKACIEYAKSIIPEYRPHVKETVWNKYEISGYNKCIDDIKNRLEQDSQVEINIFKLI